MFRFKPTNGGKKRIQRKRKKKKNRENLKTLFVLFYFLPIWVIYQRTTWLWFWELKLPLNYEVLLRKVFDDCTKILLSLSLYVCLFSVWVLRKCVKIKSSEFLDMVFDWLWWGFHLLGNKYGSMIGFLFIRFWENEGKKINFNLEILDFILIN